MLAPWLKMYISQGEVNNNGVFKVVRVEAYFCATTQVFNPFPSSFLNHTNICSCQAPVFWEDLVGL